MHIDAEEVQAIADVLLISSFAAGTGRSKTAQR